MSTTPRTASTAWEAPEPVSTPTLDGARAAIDRVNLATGMRRAGWLALLTGVVLLALGFLLRWTELTVAGVLVIILTLLCLLFTIGRPSLEARLRVPERAVVVGTPAVASLGIRNAGRRRTWGSRIDLPIGRDSASISVGSLGAGQVQWQDVRIPTRRRDIITVGPAHSVKGDPFGLTGRETRWTDVTELYVHPRTVRLPGRQSGFVHDLEGHASPHITASDMNFHALREYVPGDDRRHVHWRSSARTGTLMVRQFEESRQSRVVVALDTGRDSWLDEDEFELGVSSAGSVAVQAVAGESPLALLTSSQDLPAVTPSKVLDGLSGVERTIRGGVPDLVRGVRDREPGASVVIFITGSSASMTDVRRAGSLIDVDKRVVSIRVDRGAELRVRSAGNVTVIQLGDLAELPRAMRKAME